MQHKLPPEVDPVDNNNKFSDYFNFVSVLGSGSFGVVVAARDKKHENEVCAVKIMKKKSMTIEFIDGLRKEAIILSKFNHPNIVTFKRLIETETQFFLVMECLHGGHLNSLMKKRVESKQKFSEEEASTILQGIVSALEYIHSKDIVHRDIKPENILFADSKDLSSAKIVDFGLSAQYEFQIHHSFTERCGTRAYMAPELFRKMEYSKSVDVWSLGVIMYQLLNCGKHPLHESTDTLESYEMKIKNSQIIPPTSCSSLAKQLLTKLLAYEANERYSAAEILQHPWITRRFSDKVPLTFNDRMKSFYNKQTIMRVIKAISVIKHLQRMSEVDSSEDSQQLDSTNYHNNESIDQSIQSNIKEIRLLPSIMPNYLRQSSDTTTSERKNVYKASSFLAAPQSIRDIMSSRKTNNGSGLSRPETVVLIKQITPDSDELRKLIQNSLKSKAQSTAVSETFSQSSSSPERDFSALSMSPDEKLNSYKSSSSNNSLKYSKLSYSDLGQKSIGSPELKKSLQYPSVLVNNSYSSPQKPKRNSCLESSYRNDTREDTEELKPLQSSHRNISTEFTIRTNKRNSMNLSQERALSPKKIVEDTLSPIKNFKQLGDYSGIFTEGTSDPRSSLKNIRRSPNTQSMKNLNGAQIISDDVSGLCPLKRSSEILKLKKTDAPSEKGMRHSSLPKSSRVGSGYPALQNIHEMLANSKIYRTDQSPSKIRLPALKANEHTQRNKVSLSSERKSLNSTLIFKAV